MSRLSRRLQQSLLEVEGKPIPTWLTFRSWVDDKWYDFKDKLWWYEISNFARNLPFFIKQAWNFRTWEASYYNIELFAASLERTAQALKEDKWHKNSQKRYRECLGAAGMLRKAYSDWTWNDKSWWKQAKSNPTRFEPTDATERLYEMEYTYHKNEEYYRKMSKVIHKRLETWEKQRKADAWAFIEKNIHKWGT